MKGVRWDDAMVLEMHALHEQGWSFVEIGAKFGRPPHSVRGAFVNRRLPLMNRLDQGRFAKSRRPLTQAEIDAIADGLTALYVPKALKYDWRKMTMEQRGAFIERVRSRLQNPNDAPLTPVRGVEAVPFDYTTPEAQRIAASRNAGTDSHSHGCKLRLVSQGVIFEGEFWFWSHKAGCKGYIKARRRAYQVGDCRQLHHELYERAHGQLPKGCVVRHANGDWNDFRRENLVVLTRNAVARENQAAALRLRSAQHTGALLRRFNQQQQKGNRS